MNDLVNEKIMPKRQTPKFKFDSTVLKVIIMGAIVLVLAIPQLMVQSLIEERLQRRSEAITQIGKMWAPEAKIHAPIIIVPYNVTVQQLVNADKAIYRDVLEKRYSYMMPDALNISNEAEIKQRKRGIYKAQTFGGTLQVSGQFSSFKFQKILADAQQILWEESFLMIPTQVKTYKELEQITLKGIKTPLTLQNNVGKHSYTHFHTPLNIQFSKKSKRIVKFKYSAKIRGTSQLTFVPYSKKMNVSMKTNWPSPSFFGSTLPVEHDIRESGFKADWEASALDVGKALAAADYFQTLGDNYAASTDFGVRFFDSVDIYHQSERSVKYGTLFLIITFCAFFVFEIQKKLRVHPIQYLLIGLANIIFYVLMLSIAEHSAFEIAYLIASVAVTILISLYAKSILSSKSGATRIGMGLSLLYTFLYFILAGEDYSLLLGSLLLFSCLSAVMYATRNIQSNALPEAQPETA